MTRQIRLARSGINALTETDPNNFIFHSAYNTFKIIATGTINQIVKYTSTTISITHGLSYTPLIYAFMKADTNDEAVSPNYMWLQTGIYNNVGIDTASADDTKIYFFVRQYNNQDVTIKIRYYIFEIPL